MLPLYYISCAHLLVAVIRKIKKEFRTFLWGHSSDPRDMHVVSWDSVCKPKKLGHLALTTMTERRILLFVNWLVN